MKPNTGRWVYSLGGVLAVLAGVIALNFILGAVPARVDLTEGRIYTLSDGTRKVLGKLEAPVRVRFYFNAGDENVPVPTRAYAARVEDLLREFRAASGGKVQIEKLNPQPDSDAEDSANPLSDARLSELLAREGIRIARRTVAKYREELHIPSSSIRKVERSPASAPD